MHRPAIDGWILLIKVIFILYTIMAMEISINLLNYEKKWNSLLDIINYIINIRIIQFYSENDLLSLD